MITDLQVFEALEKAGKYIYIDVLWNQITYFKCMKLIITKTNNN